MNNVENIIVLFKDIGQNPVLMKIKNTEEELEKTIGGKIEILPYEDIVIICNKERSRLSPNIYLNTTFDKFEPSIRGKIIVANKENAIYKSLDKEQAYKYYKLLVAESFKYKNTKSDIQNILNANKQLQVQTKNKENYTLDMILKVQVTILNFIKEYIKNN